MAGKGGTMKNTLQDLNNALFQQLETLQDDEEMKDPEKFEKEMRRSKAMVDISSQIILNNKLRLDACKYVSDYEAQYNESGRKAALSMIGVSQ